jgi:hypothetical protein
VDHIVISCEGPAVCLASCQYLGFAYVLVIATSFRTPSGLIGMGDM